MKPDTRTAMQQMINEVRLAIPFDAPEAQICADDTSCKGCSLKLLEYLDMELDNWQDKLNQGESPSFGDLNKLSKTSRKIYTTLKNNGLISR